MEFELELNKTNRIKLARAFRNNLRVDYSIDCVLEGQMGKAYVDSIPQPSAYRITVGPFWYFAGDPCSPAGYEMIKNLPPYALLMPCSPGWVEAAQEVFGARLRLFPRYSFSSAGLSQTHLSQILDGSRYAERVIPLDLELSARLSVGRESPLELSDFDSAADFVDRGLGFTLLDGDKAMGVAYSSLVCSQGIEVSIYVEEQYRRRGVATALASRLLLECRQYNLRPNWDAANPESCQLATKLGYVFSQAYTANYYAPQ